MRPKRWYHWLHKVVTSGLPGPRLARIRGMLITVIVEFHFNLNELVA